MKLAWSVGVAGWFLGLDLRRWHRPRLKAIDTYTDIPRRRYTTTSAWVGPLCVMAPGRFYWR